jgi:hypothetical protein
MIPVEGDGACLGRCGGLLAVRRASGLLLVGATDCSAVTH